MSLQIGVYESPTGPMLADWTGSVAQASMSTNSHGFAALELDIAMPAKDAFGWLEYLRVAHIAVSSIAGVVWEGRLEDVARVRGGVRVTALGYWRALLDAPYTAFWAESGSAGWVTATGDVFSNTQPQLFEMDNNNRIFISLRDNETYPAGVSGALLWRTPDRARNGITELSFDYECRAADESWAFEVVSWNDEFNAAAVEWYLLSEGSEQGGTATVAIDPTRPNIVVQMRNAAASPFIYTGGTAQEYMKLTQIEIRGSDGGGNLLASEIVADIVEFVSGLNPMQLRYDLSGIEESAAKIDKAIYEDVWLADIVTDLARTAASNSGEEWVASVWEDRRLIFAPRALLVSETWYVDLVDLDLERSLNVMFNSAYATYSDANNRILRTDVADNEASQQQWGIVRRGAVQSSTGSELSAERNRDAFLVANSTVDPRAGIEIRAIYDEHGMRSSLWRVRAGDRIVVRNVPMSLSPQLAAGLREMIISETEYDLLSNSLSIVPRYPAMSVVPQLQQLGASRARRSALSSGSVIRLAGSGGGPIGHGLW